MILDDFKLDGKVALVTGARTGIGQAIAAALAEAGADVAGVSRGDMKETQARVEACGRRFAALRADLSAPRAAPELVGKTVAAFGRIDILVNNAGIIRRAPAIAHTEEDWDAVMDTNLKTVFFLCQAAAKQFLKQGGGGKIVNIASLLSFQGGILVPGYAASKSGVAGLTRELACEWAKDRINVNAIAPGYIATDVTAALRDDPQRNKAIMDRIPAGRWGAPEDLQGLAVFLSSKASDYLHGFVYAADGGWLAR